MRNFCKFLQKQKLTQIRKRQEKKQCVVFFFQQFFVTDRLEISRKFAWELEFCKYKQFPEFNRSEYHSRMQLSDFKKIYFWEWSHRFLGRFIGIAFTLPLVYYIYKGYINRQMYDGLLSLFGLGASQGLVGWWMVKSGLYESGNDTYNNLPKVSPYRLSTHLTFAFLIYCLLLYHGMNSYARNNKLLRMIVDFNV